MNHQGDSAEQVNSDNANVQNGVGPHLSMETLQRLFPSSSPFTAESRNRFPDRLSRPHLNLPQQSANVVTNNGRNVGVAFQESITGALGLSISSASNSLARNPQRFPHRLFGSNAPHYQGNERNNAPINLELSLSLTQAPSGTQIQGAIRSSTSNAIDSVALSNVVEEQVMHSSILTNTTLLPTKRKFDNHAFGELQVGESSSINAQATLAKRRTNANDNNVNTSLLVPEMPLQPLNEVSQTRGVQASSPTQAPLFIQNDTLMFSSTSKTTATNSSQQPELAFNFHQALLDFPHINNMSTRNAPRAIRSLYSQNGIEVMAPLHGQRNIQGSSMPRSHVGWAIQENSLQNSGFERTANLLGDFPNRSPQNVSLITTGSNVIVPNATPRVRPPFNPVDANGRVHNVGAIIFPGQSNESPSASSPSQSSQEMNLPTTIFNSRIENQCSSVEAIVHFGENFEPVISIRGFVNHERRRRIAAEIHSILYQLRSGHTQVLEELMVLDHSLALSSVELHGNIQQRIIQQNNHETRRLTVEEIMLLIRRENFKFTGEETLESKESCCICQEDYVDREEVGRLDCVHKFHVECIKQWLMLKNVCPICKQIALAMHRVEVEVRENENGVDA